MNFKNVMVKKTNNIKFSGLYVLRATRISKILH